MSDLNKATSAISRRTVLKGAGAAAGLAAGGAFLAACGGDDAATDATTEVTGPVAFGARTVDEIPTQQLRAVLDAFTAATGIEYTYNATESNAFQDNLSQYLQGTPDDVFQWMAGFRMKFFADQGLLVDISDVWAEAGGAFTAGYKGASTASDGNQYFVPFTWYPWGVLYRKSVWADAGIDPASVVTWADFMDACSKFQAAGITPIAMGNKGGWEAMGTFSLINMRTNGYQFHVDLLAGNESWTDDRVKQTFANWQETFQYQNSNPLDLEWDGAADLLVRREAAMQVMGAFAAERFIAVSDEEYADLAIMAFPEIDPAYGRDSIEAPIDGFCLAAGGTNSAAGKELAKFLMSKEAIDAWTGVAPALGASSEQDTSSFDEFRVQQVELVQSAANIAQFLDRDSRPDFAGPIVGPALQSFMQNPADVDSICENLQAQWDALPPL